MSSSFGTKDEHTADSRDLLFKDTLPLVALHKQRLLMYEVDHHTFLREENDEQLLRTCVIDLTGVDKSRQGALLHDFRYMESLQCRHFLRYKHWYLDDSETKLYVTYEPTCSVHLSKHLSLKVKEHGELPERDILLILIQLLCMARYLSSLRFSDTDWIKYMFCPSHIYASSMGILSFDFVECFAKAFTPTIDEDELEFLAPELLNVTPSVSLPAFNLDASNAKLLDMKPVTSSARRNQVNTNFIYAHDNVITTYNTTNDAENLILRGWERMQSLDERSLIWCIGYLVLRMCLCNRKQQQEAKDLQMSNTSLRIDGATVHEFVHCGVVAKCIDKQPLESDSKEAVEDRDRYEGTLHNQLGQTRFIEIDDNVPHEVVVTFEQYRLRDYYSDDLIDFIGRSLKAIVELRPLLSSIIPKSIYFQQLVDIAEYLGYRDPLGNTPLHIACAYGCDSFLSEYSNILVYTKLGNDYRQSASMIAAYMGYEKCLSQLIKYEYNCRDSYGRTALMYAASQGHEECIHQCIMEVKQVDNDNKTALLYAVEKGHWEAVEILLPFEAGRIPDAGEPAICIAARNGYARCLRSLLVVEQEFLPDALRIITEHPAALGMTELSDEAVIKTPTGILVKNHNAPYAQPTFLKPETCKFVDFSPLDNKEERDKKIRGLFLIVKTHCKHVKLMHQWETEEEFVKRILYGSGKDYLMSNSGMNYSEHSSMFISF